MKYIFNKSEIEKINFFGIGKNVFFFFFFNYLSVIFIIFYGYLFIFD